MMRYQSPLHKTVIKASAGVFFSVSVKYRSRCSCTLLLRCSSNKDFCTQSYGNYQLCHSPEETLCVRVLPGSMLDVSMKNGPAASNATIYQVTSPFETGCDRHHPLDEQFNISVASSVKGSANQKLSMSSWAFNTSEHSAEQSQSDLESTVSQGQDDFFFSWEVLRVLSAHSINLGFCVMAGLLQVQLSHVDDPLSHKDVVGCLPFSFQCDKSPEVPIQTKVATSSFTDLSNQSAADIVTATWTSSSRRFQVILDESLSALFPEINLKPTLADYFTNLLKVDGNVTLLKMPAEGVMSICQLVCVSVASNLDHSSPDSGRAIEQLTSVLALGLHLSSCHLKCHDVLVYPSRTQCIYSMPSSSAEQLLKSWSNAEEAHLLQESCSGLPSLISKNPILAITDKVGNAHWELPSHREILPDEHHPFAWRDKKIRQEDLFKLENTIAKKQWQCLARRLRKEDDLKTPCAFDDHGIELIKKKYPGDDRECLHEILNDWIKMSPLHTVGPLYDALAMEFGDTASCKHHELHRYAWRDTKIGPEHLSRLENTIAEKQWQRLARRLHNKDDPKGSHAFDDGDIKCVEEKYPGDDKKCLHEILNKWTSMSSLHGVGFLYDAIAKEFNNATASVLRESSEVVEPQPKRRKFQDSAEHYAIEQETEVTAMWTSSSGRFDVIVDKWLAILLVDADLKLLLAYYFKHLLKNDEGHITLLKTPRDELPSNCQLVCISVAAKFDQSPFSSATAIKQRLTPLLSIFIGLPLGQLKCHAVVASLLSYTKFIYSLPALSAKQLLQSWSNENKACTLQQCCRTSLSGIQGTKPILSITNKIGNAQWELTDQQASFSHSSRQEFAPFLMPPANRRKSLLTADQPLPMTKKEKEGFLSSTITGLASQGTKLRQDTQLFRALARRFADVSDVYYLADALLEGITLTGGRSWVDAKSVVGGTLDPQLVAMQVLEHWYDHSLSSELDGRTLYDVLRRIVPRVAEEFEKELLITSVDFRDSTLVKTSPLSTLPAKASKLSLAADEPLLVPEEEKEGSSFVEVQMKSVTHPDASGNYVEAAVRSSLLHVERVSEERIPYLPCQVTSGTVKENGLPLVLGDVTATFPPGALLLHSHMSMMVRRIKPGFQLHGKIFSPQVALGPHCNCPLNAPVKIVLPLKVVGTVVVLASRTAAGCAPKWEVVPASQYVVHDDRIEVGTSHLSSYQAQCGRHSTIIKPMSNYVFFSVSYYTEGPPGTSALLLRCSGDKEKITKRLGDYQWCHSPDSTLEIQAVRGDMLSLSIKSKDASIKQTTTPWKNDLELDCPLDESFHLSVGSSAEEESTDKLVSTTVLGVPSTVSSGQSKLSTATYSQGPEPREEKQLDFSWDIECNKEGQSNGFAVLTVTSQRLSSLEDYTERSETECPYCAKCNAMRDITGLSRRLKIKVHWLRGENPEESHKIGADGQNPPNINFGQRQAGAAGKQELAPSHHGNITLPSEWQTVKLSRIRNPLFPSLASTKWPFSARWKDILRRLPAVQSVEDSSRASRLQPAYPCPDNEIDNIKKFFLTQGSLTQDSDCLQRALNNWVDGEGGEATIAHLFAVLASDTVHLLGAAREFFIEYFSEPWHHTE